MTIKARRYLISFATHGTILAIGLGGSLLAIVMSLQNIAIVLSTISLFYLLTLRINPIGRLVQEKLIREATCPGCGYTIDLINLWKCPCGYSITVPRSALSPCPNCGRFFKWIDCPFCETSIPL